MRRESLIPTALAIGRDCRARQRGSGFTTPKRDNLGYRARSLRLAPARDRVMHALRIAAHRDRCQCSDSASAFGALRKGNRRVLTAIAPLLTQLGRYIN